MSRWRPQHYLAEGRARGHSPELLARAVEYGNQIAQANPGVLPLFTLAHLAKASEVSYKSLRAFASRDERYGYPYRFFRLRKKSVAGTGAGYRIICVPRSDLRKVQRFIVDHLLSKVPTHSSSVAYSRGSRIAEAARQHCRAQWLIKLDVHEFFESISERSAYHVFRQLKLPALLAFELARICTRVVPKPWRSRWTTKSPKRYSIIDYRQSFLGALPQGAPTSPMLANLASRRLDEALADLALSYGLTYTRYADDIIFSTSDSKFSREKARIVIKKSYAAMRLFGLQPNMTKTTVSPPGARKLVLGLLVDGPEPRLSRDFKTKLRQYLYFCASPKIGPIKHARQKKFSAVLGLRNHIRGLISYAAQIEPDFAKCSLEAFKKIEWPL